MITNIQNCFNNNNNQASRKIKSSIRKSLGQLPSCFVYWFPKAGHTELALNHTLYNLTNWFGEKELIAEQRSEGRQISCSQSGKGHPCYRFKLNLSEEAFEKLEESVSLPLPQNTCSGNIASVISKATNAVIPFFYGLLPAQFADYLHQKHHQKALSDLDDLEPFDSEKQEAASNHKQDLDISEVQYFGLEKDELSDWSQDIQKKKKEELIFAIAEVGFIGIPAWFIGNLVKVASKIANTAIDVFSS